MSFTLSAALAGVRDAEIVDGRTIPCSVKHGLIFQRWNQLAVGEAFILVNGHLPEPLRYQFAAMFPDCFTWETLLDEGDLAAVKITRVKENPAHAPTPPARGETCGHHHH